MIVRLFRPRVHPGRRADFERSLLEVAVPFAASHDGPISQVIGRPPEPDATEFVFVTVWRDPEAVEGFAGDRWQDAVIDPSERDLLAETWIGHHETLEPV